MKTLIIGGSRSGKSSLAVRWAADRSTAVCVIVTAQGSDPEMAARIEAHRRERPSAWRVREAPVHLAAAFREESAVGGVLVIDCLTVWTANCLWPDTHARELEPNAISAEAGTSGTAAPSCDVEGWRRERDELLLALQETRAEAIVVTNEVGTGIVPANAAARLFRDEHGWLNQAVAAVCDEVFLVTAGLPFRLKPTS